MWTLRNREVRQLAQGHIVHLKSSVSSQRPGLLPTILYTSHQETEAWRLVNLTKTTCEAQLVMSLDLSLSLSLPPKCIL